MTLALAQVVAPRRKAPTSQWKLGRAGALVACCGAALLVALVGTVDNVATPAAPVLAMKASLAATPEVVELPKVSFLLVSSLWAVMS